MSEFISLKIPNIDKVMITDYLYHATSVGLDCKNLILPSGNQ